MITPAYSATATERVLPRLALDFTTGVLDPRVTVTRALDTATRVNSSGLIETVNANLPRFDYDPDTLAPKGLLIEETRSNLLTYSAAVGGTDWANANFGSALPASITTNYATAPDGTQTASRLVLSLGGGTTTASYVVVQHNTISITNGASYSPSIYLKSNDGNTYTVLYRDDLGAGGTSQLWVITPTWKRFTLSYTATNTSAYGVKLWLRGGLGTSATADILAWGGQLEAGAFATSYIPTTTTSLTRNADNVSMTGANFSSWFNASEGSLMLQGDTLTVANPNSTTLANLYLNSSNNIRFWVWNGQPTNLRWSVTASGASSADIPKAITANTSFKAVGSYKLNRFVCALNGSAATEDTSGSVPSGLNVLFIGSIGGVNEVFSGHIAKINFYTQSLTNSETQAFSK